MICFIAVSCSQTQPCMFETPPDCFLCNWWTCIVPVFPPPPSAWDCCSSALSPWWSEGLPCVFSGSRSLTLLRRLYSDAFLRTILWLAETAEDDWGLSSPLTKCIFCKGTRSDLACVMQRWWSAARGMSISRPQHKCLFQTCRLGKWRDFRGHLNKPLCCGG